MKLKKLLKMDFVEEFGLLLITPFEKELFNDALRNYASHGNPIRFHNFAFVMRELVQLIINRKGPINEIKKCSWYERESEYREVTRRQQLKYCAQGKLSDKYFHENELKSLNLNIKAYNKEFNFFNKYTHITEKHHRACPRKFFDDARYILERSKEIVEELEDLERIVKSAIESRIYEPVMNKAIESVPNDLDILAQRVYIESCGVEKLHITYFDDEIISVTVEGTVDVSQNYGPKDDPCEINMTYPFELEMDVKVGDPNDITVTSNEIEVDTSSWYE
jgi:hypothetical protein